MDITKLKQAMTDATPPITFEKVMQVYGMKTKSHALYWLKKWRKLGLVEYIRKGIYGKWYLK